MAEPCLVSELIKLMKWRGILQPGGHAVDVSAHRLGEIRSWVYDVRSSSGSQLVLRLLLAGVVPRHVFIRDARAMGVQRQSNLRLDPVEPRPMATSQRTSV
jgi:hypothetical protein